MRRSLRHSDPLLLGLQPEPTGNSVAARTVWERANFSAKSSITLALTEPVQVRAMACTDDDNKSAHDFWNFLESTFTKSNEQAIQNVRCQIDFSVYVEGTDWDKHLNKFNALIAELAIQNVYIKEKVKKSMIIRYLPESLSFLCTVASAQPDMTVETLNALIRAELNRKKIQTICKVSITTRASP